MGSRLQRVDEYIIKSAEFAIPILDYWRETVHAACPDVKEIMKWSMPFFEYKNYNLCNMAAFKNHCGFHFWLASKMSDPDQLLSGDEGNTGMAGFKKIAKIEDLPSEEQIVALINDAMSLIDKGVKLTKDPAKKVVKELVVPDYFLEAIEDNPDAEENFERFTLSQKKEYVDWILEAKSETTRLKRMQQAVEWIEEGKTRNWKYQR
ncbi:YdeI family protein [Dyadobacter sp. 3J3]|uniref:YdeI/OmpD-associated family protein n=1 Tax=Dyadobacter sp. 3J3 TaxID=2606600 RepID=UPI001359F130|nr:YdeI/OmpD-associated family protein [Dyadobacter sp. 3J3]